MPHTDLSKAFKVANKEGGYNVIELSRMLLQASDFKTNGMADQVYDEMDQSITELIAAKDPANALQLIRMSHRAQLHNGEEDPQEVARHVGYKNQIADLFAEENNFLEAEHIKLEVYDEVEVGSELHTEIHNFLNLRLETYISAQDDENAMRLARRQAFVELKMDIKPQKSYEYLLQKRTEAFNNNDIQQAFNLHIKICQDLPKEGKEREKAWKYFSKLKDKSFENKDIEMAHKISKSQFDRAPKNFTKDVIIEKSFSGMMDILAADADISETSEVLNKAKWYWEHAAEKSAERKQLWDFTSGLRDNAIKNKDAKTATQIMDWQLELGRTYNGYNTEVDYELLDSAGSARIDIAQIHLEQKNFDEAIKLNKIHENASRKQNTFGAEANEFYGVIAEKCIEADALDLAYGVMGNIFRNASDNKGVILAKRYEEKNQIKKAATSAYYQFSNAEPYSPEQDEASAYIIGLTDRLILEENPDDAEEAVIMALCCSRCWLVTSAEKKDKAARKYGSKGNEINHDNLRGKFDQVAQLHIKTKGLEKATQHAKKISPYDNSGVTSLRSELSTIIFKGVWDEHRKNNDGTAMENLTNMIGRERLYYNTPKRISDMNKNRLEIAKAHKDKGEIDKAIDKAQTYYKCGDKGAWEFLTELREEMKITQPYSKTSRDIAEWQKKNAYDSEKAEIDFYFAEIERKRLEEGNFSNVLAGFLSNAGGDDEAPDGNNPHYRYT